MAADRVVICTWKSGHPIFAGITFDTLNEARGIDPLGVPMHTYVEVQDIRVRSMLLYG